MAAIQLPDIVRRVIRVLATDDDTTELDRILSVTALVFVATLLTPFVAHILPIVPGFLVLPLTAGVLTAIVNRLS